MKSQLKDKSSSTQNIWAESNPNSWPEAMSTSPITNSTRTSESDPFRAGRFWTGQPGQEAEPETEEEWLERTRAQQQQQELEDFVRANPGGRDKSSQTGMAKVMHHRSGEVLELQRIDEVEDASDHDGIKKTLNKGSLDSGETPKV